MISQSQSSFPPTTECAICETLEAVFVQSLPASEIVVVDDASTDGTAEVVSNLVRIAPVPLKLIEIAENTGTPAEPLNVGLRAATSEYVAILDQDDLSCPDRLRLETDYLDAHEDCIAVGGQALFIDPDGEPLCVRDFPLNHNEIDASLMLQPGCRANMLHPSLLVRRHAVLSIGGYRTHFRASYDRDLLLRLAEHGRLANLDKVVLRYRLHSTSFSHQRWREHQQYSVRAVSDAYERRGLPIPEVIHTTVSSRANASDAVWWTKLALSGRNFKAVRKHAVSALASRPWKWQSYRLFVRAMLGRYGEYCANAKSAVLGRPRHNKKGIQG